MAVWYFSLSHSVMSKSFDLLGYLLVQYVYHMALATGSKEICHCTLISSLCNWFGDGVWSYCPPHHVRRQDPFCLWIGPEGIQWDVIFSNDCNDLQPPDCVHQLEEDAGMEGDSSYWLGRVRRERRQRSCIERCLAWQGFWERKRKSAVNIRQTAWNSKGRELRVDWCQLPETGRWCPCKHTW